MLPCGSACSGRATARLVDPLPDAAGASVSPMRISGSVITALVTMFALSACGGGELGAKDKEACDLAADGGTEAAESIYGLQSVIENEDLKAQAERIKMGTSESDDDSAMEDMVKVCKDNGYEPKPAED